MSNDEISACSVENHSHSESAGECQPRVNAKFYEKMMVDLLRVADKEFVKGAYLTFDEWDEYLFPKLSEKRRRENPAQGELAL